MTQLATVCFCKYRFSQGPAGTTHVWFSSRFCGYKIIKYQRVSYSRRLAQYRFQILKRKGKTSFFLKATRFDQRNLLINSEPSFKALTESSIEHPLAAFRLRLRQE